MRKVKILIGPQRGSIPRDVILEGVLYVMEKTNYIPKTSKSIKRKPSNSKVK